MGMEYLRFVMLEQYPSNGIVAACLLSFLFIASPGCIILEEPPPKPDFEARAAQAADTGLADTGLADIRGADTDEDLPPISCETSDDCNVWSSTHNITAVCSGSGTCINRCRGGFENCDGDMESNGCEADLANSLDNCGVCGEVCKLKNLNYQPICTATGENHGVAYKCDVKVGVCATGYTKSEDGTACVCKGAIGEDGKCIAGEDG